MTVALFGYRLDNLHHGRRVAPFEVAWTLGWLLLDVPLLGLYLLPAKNTGGVSTEWRM